MGDRAVAVVFNFDFWPKWRKNRDITGKVEIYIEVNKKIGESKLKRLDYVPQLILVSSSAG